MQRIILSHVNLPSDHYNVLNSNDVISISTFILAVLGSRVWDCVSNIVVGWSDDNNFL